MEEPNEPIKEAIEQAGLPQFPDFGEIKKELQQKAAANLHHTPRQQGPYIICVSCEYAHTLAYIGPLKKLTGFGEAGEPIIEDITM